MPFTYPQVRKLYDKLYEAGVTTKPLSEWAAEENAASDSDLYSEGVDDNIIKRTSYGLDKLLEATGLPVLTEEFGRNFERGIFDPGGEGATGAAIGKKLGRGAVNMLPMLIPGVGLGATAGRLGGMAALSGADTYTETGSPAAGVISAVTAAAMPKVAQLAEQQFLKRTGGTLIAGQLADDTGRVTSNIREFFPASIKQRVGQEAAGQVGASALSEVSRMTVAGFDPNQEYEFSPTDAMLEMTLGQVPFATFYGAHKAMGGLSHTARRINLEKAIELSRTRIEERAVREELGKKSPIEQIPVVEENEISPSVVAETKIVLARLRGDQVRLKDDMTLSPEQKVEKANQLLQEEVNLIREAQPVTRSTVFGDSIAPEGVRDQVVGRELRSTGKWRAVMVEDIPANPEELRGKIVTYSTAYEPNPTKRSDGMTVFGLPDPQWRTIKTGEEWNARYKRTDDGTPELPEQDQPATREQMFSHIEDLKRAEMEAESARSPADLQQAVTRINNVKAELGLPETNDGTLQKIAKVVADSNLVAPEDVPYVAVKVEAKKTAKLLRAQEEKATTNRAREFRTAQEGAVDEGTIQEVTGVKAIEESLAAKATKNSERLLGGKLNQLYETWASGGRQGGFEAFKEKVWRVHRTGEGLGKGVSERITKLAKEPEVAATPFADMLGEVAVRVVSSEDGRRAFDAWDRKGETSLRDEAQMFATLTDEFKTLDDVDINDAAEYLNSTQGVPIPEAKSEIADFLKRPHVQVWKSQMETELNRIQQKNMAPARPELTPIPGEQLVTIQRADGSTYQASFGGKFYEENRPSIAKLTEEGKWSHTVLGKDETMVESTVRSPIKPYTPEPEELQTIQQLGLDSGEGMRQYLLTSPDKLFQALAKDYGKFSASLARMKGQLHDGDVSWAQHDLPNKSVELFFSKGLLGTSRAYKDYAVAHEMTHGLTMMEIDNPTKVQLKNDLENIRQRLIELLPKNERRAFDKAVADKWLTRFSAKDGAGNWDSFGPGLGEDHKLILYGLLNVHEMVAQGLTEPQMRVFMQQARTEKASWFSRFSNTIKQLIGLGERVPDSVFEEFLSKTDALIQRGEHVSDFNNYANRYFENLGLSENQTKVQTGRALGLVLESQGASHEDLLSKLQLSLTVRNPQVQKATRDLTRMLLEKGDDFVQLTSVLDELGYDTSKRGLDDYALETLLGNDQHDVLELMPDTAVRYIFAQANDMHQVLSAVQGAVAEKNQGLINLADPKGLRLPVGKAMIALDRMLSQSRMHDEAVRTIQGLSTMTPDVFMERVMSDPTFAPPILKDGEPKDKMGKVKWFFGTPAQLSRSDPKTAELFARGYQLQTNARIMFGNIMKVMGIDIHNPTNTLTKAGLENSIRTIANPRASRAVDQYMFWNNKAAQQEGRGVTMLTDSHPEIQKVMAKLTLQERSDVIDVVAKAGTMTRVSHQEQLNKMGQIATVRGAKVLLKNGTTKVSDALTLADTLFKALGNITDPTSQANIQMVQQRTTTEGFLALAKFMQPELAKHQIWREFFSTNPDWATGQRQERWLIEYKKNGKLVLDQGSSRKEVLERAKGSQVIKEPWDQWANRGDDEFPMVGSDFDKIHERLQELEATQLADQKAKGLSPEAEESFVRLSPSTQLAREAAAQTPGIPNFKTPPRGLTKGADEIPWLWNHISWNKRVTTYWTRQLLRAQKDLHLADPELANRQDLRDALNTHIESMLKPDPDVIRKINKFSTVWYMGFAPASALVNGFQTATTLIPELTRITNRPVDSYRRWGKALSEIVDEGMHRKGWRGKEHNQLMKDAARDGERSYSMWDDDAATQESIEHNWKRQMNKHKPQTLGQRLGSMAGNYSTWGMFLFKAVEHFNNKVTLIAAFDTYREQGLSYDEAKARAYEVNHAVNYGGGKANRPIGIYAGKDNVTRSMAMLGTNLQGYNLGVMGQLGRYLQDGLFRPQGLKPSEVYAARKAATQMLATQLTLAGSLGLPAVSGLIAILNQVMPQLEVSKNLRELVQSIMNEDEENGSTFTDLAMTGVPSMLGWDFQSRLSMGNTLPGVSEYNGFQPEALAGPVLNALVGFGKGAGGIATGEPKSGLNFVPPGVRKILKLATMNEGNPLTATKMEDYRGRSVVSDLTPGERAGVFLGFQPKRLSDFNSASRVADQLQTVSNRREGQWKQQQAEEVLKGNFGTVRETILERARQEKNLDVFATVRGVAKAAEELTFPRDLRREGTSRTGSERSRLLGTFGLDASQPSEASRVQFRHQIEQRLGLRSQRSNDLKEAQLMDQLRVQHPEATRSELRSLVQQALRRRPERTLSDDLE